MTFVGERARQRMSKFQGCLPDTVARRFLSRRLFDLDRARRVIAESQG